MSRSGNYFLTKKNDKSGLLDAMRPDKPLLPLSWGGQLEFFSAETNEACTCSKAHFLQLYLLLYRNMDCEWWKWNCSWSPVNAYLASSSAERKATYFGVDMSRLVLHSFKFRWVAVVVCSRLPDQELGDPGLNPHSTKEGRWVTLGQSNLPPRVVVIRKRRTGACCKTLWVPTRD